MALNSGFDAVAITDAIKKMNASASDLMRALHEDMKSQFIEPMGGIWACQDAVDFFQSLKTTMDGLITKSDSTFQSVVDTMNQGAVNWARNTGNEGAYNQIPYHNYTGRTVVDMIKENINNQRGIDKGAAEDILKKLTNIKTACDAALTSAASAVAGASNSGFIGGDQAANLEASLNDIKTTINNSLDEFNTTTSQSINETIKKYGSLETKTADTFNVKKSAAAGGVTQSTK